MSTHLPNLVITFLLTHKSSILLIRRAVDEANFPGHWAFPGGKVEIGETFIDALRREVHEETGLPISDRFMLIDGYSFGHSTGIALLVEALSQTVASTECAEYSWIETASQLQGYEPRIAGIDNHFALAQLALMRQTWQSLDAAQLTPDRYINR